MIAGTLTDKGMNDAGKMIARIDDKPYEVPGYILPYLAPIEKGTRVEYTESNEVITKIMTSTKSPAPLQEKMMKAGFGVSNTVPSPTPAEMPAKKPVKVFDGAILSINHERRSLALDGGAILVWSSDKDEVLKKFNARYKCRVEHDGEHLLSIVSTFVPNTAGKSAGKNEKLIVMQHNFGIVAEVFMECNAFQDQDYNEALELIYGKTKDISDRMMKDCGGA